jgi:NADH-quinone oxidoreductase subunit G
MNAITIEIDGKPIIVDGERNVLELIRKAKIDLPTFCYHSELSVYGACRLCMVEVEGRGLSPACSTLPEAGLKIRTHTEEIREMRQIIVELLLANHDQSCPTCPKSVSCQLQSLARKLGIQKVRFKGKPQGLPVDNTSWSLVRDPNKCVLCGDCVRMCSEVQSIGAIDFAYRGSQTVVMPAFNKTLDGVECIYCGQCARVCPTGALTPKSEVEKVWKALDDKNLMVVAQIAPAVRVALGEAFGLEPGTTTTGPTVAALKALGFKKVFDTSFTADLTVLEESHEFLGRFKEKKDLPQFTSCCPGWVKFVEQYYPEYVPNLSSCKSPQQMLGSVGKEMIARTTGLKKEQIVMVAIMPCTAKKFEAKRPEFTSDGAPDVDHVLTTQELARMIQQAGLQFKQLEPESFDLPFGFKTGAGVIFGATGGVSEAVLRYATEQVAPGRTENYEFLSVRGEEGIRAVDVPLNGTHLRMAVVNGLGNARKLIKKIKAGEAQYDFIEVMACPGGCIGGAGQPVSNDPDVRKKRTQGIYKNDKMLQLHRSQENPYVTELYKEVLGHIGSQKAHHLLHTRYQHRKRITREGIRFGQPGGQEKKLEVDVCFGTSCFLKGSQTVLKDVLGHIQEKGLSEQIGVKASFCFEKCGRGPTVRVGDKTIERCTPEKAKEAIDSQIESKKIS